MSTGAVKPFVDYSGNTSGDSGETDATSILPIETGETVTSPILNRPPESLRQRSENVRDVLDDTLYLRDADRGGLTLGGPAVVTWPGSTTAVASGIPTLSDNLYLIPFLTPGYPQVAPVPPVASVYGTLTLNRTGPAAGITVTSNRRSYFGGDKINVTVVLGGAAAAVLSDVGAGDRSILLTVTAGTTLTAAIALLNAITAVPSATQLVVASLAAGATGTDTLVTAQAKQYVAGNIDAEAHTLTPAAFTTFFGTVGNRLAEGDTLCIQYASLAEASPGTGGRRQSIPENTNTSIPAGSFFNSRANPEKLVNAIPIAKVINNTLVFIGGFAIAAGASAAIATGSIATTTALGTVKLLHASLTPAAPVVVSDGSRNVANGVVGLSATRTAAVTSTTGTAVTGTAGGGNGNGVSGEGSGVGSGVFGQGQNAAPGVQGEGGNTSGPGVLGNGGTDGDGVQGNADGLGTGIVGTGDATGVGGSFTGGQGVIARNLVGGGAAVTAYPALLNTKPAFVSMTADDYPRALVDHNGYPMGQITVVDANWTKYLGVFPGTAGPMSDPDWSYSISATSALVQAVIGNDATIINCIQATTGASPGDYAVIFSRRAIMSLLSYTTRVVVVAEFAVTGGNTAQDQVLAVGWGTGGAAELVNDANSIYLYRQNGFTNWLYNVNKDGVGGAVGDTGRPPLAGVDAVDILRIEISEGVISFYVNGVFGGSRTNTHKIAHNYSLVQSLKNNGDNGIAAFGPMRACWANKEIPPNM